MRYSAFPTRIIRSALAGGALLVVAALLSQSGGGAPPLAPGAGLLSPPLARAQASTNADLSDVAFADVGGGTTGIALSATFAAATTAYDVGVSPDVQAGGITITPTVAHASARFAFLSGSPLEARADDNASANGFQVNVEDSMGAGIDLVVRVTAEDGTTTKDYTFRLRRDYDDDDNGYIDVRTRAQLEAISGDLNTNGDQTNVPDAFSNPMGGDRGARFGCPSTGCVGYELRSDIDLSGSAWTMLGNFVTDFTGKFKGNGHIISGLNDGSGSDSSLFGLFVVVGSTGVAEGFGLTGVNVTNAGGGGAAAAYPVGVRLRAAVGKRTR